MLSIKRIKQKTDSVLNAELRREAVENLQIALRLYENVTVEFQRASVALLDQRQRAAGEFVESLDLYARRLGNLPADYRETVARFGIEMHGFGQDINEIDASLTRAKLGTPTDMVVAGAGVEGATDVPRAVVAIATIVGAASTSAASATSPRGNVSNFTHARRGGGWLTGGKAHGFLAFSLLAGGAIGGVAAIGTAAVVRKRNANLAGRADVETGEIKEETRFLRKAQREINDLAKQTKAHTDGCIDDFEVLKRISLSDYIEFDKTLKERLASVISHLRKLSDLLHEEVALLNDVPSDEMPSRGV